MTQRTWIMLLVMGALAMGAFYLSQMTGPAFAARVPVTSVLSWTAGLLGLVALVASAERHSRLHGGQWQLDRAIRKGDMPEIRAALRKRIDVNGCGTGWTPLASAAANGNLEVCRILVEMGADPNTPCYKGRFPLIKAAEMGRLEVVRFLLDQGADPTCQSEPHTEEELRVKRGDPSAYPSIRGLTPLLAASFFGHTEVAELLLTVGSPLEAEADHGHTALTGAAARGHHRVVHSLLEAGADPEHGDESQFRPLHYAANFGREEVVALLLAGGAEVNSRDECQQTPLMVAYATGNLAVAKLLLEAGADLSLVCLRGHTAEEHGRMSTGK